MASLPEHAFIGMIVGKTWSETEPWPKPTLKGKPLLVNDTFIRVDDVPSYTVYSKYGNRFAINVESSMGKKIVNPSKCQGHVLIPDYEAHSLEFKYYPTAALKSRCMTEEEINEARGDHIFCRTFHSSFADRRDTAGAYINTPGIEQPHGHLDGDIRLRAFNIALHKKRQQIAAIMAERGLKWDYNKFFTASYDEPKMSEMFRRQIPPPPPGSKTGREA